jgi:DNA-binding YbaB/EbfC family protein
MDIGALTQRVREMQGDLTSVRGELLSLEGRGSAGNGAVTVAVVGEGLLADLFIDPSVIDPDDAHGLADMVMEAVNEASRNLGEQRAARLSTITGSVHALLAGIHRPGQ